MQRSSRQQASKSPPTLREYLFPPMVIEPPVILSSPPPPGGHTGPKPPPIPIDMDPRPSDPPSRWYQRLEIVLPALIALGLVLRALVDVYGDVLRLKRNLSQRTRTIQILYKYRTSTLLRCFVHFYTIILVVGYLRKVILHCSTHTYTLYIVQCVSVRVLVVVRVLVLATRTLFITQYEYKYR